MTDFLLELLSEEIPARMQAKARDDLARLFADEIGKAGLSATAIETFSTPRRLALIARGLPEQTQAVSEEIKGPRANAPAQALEGFLRKTGLTHEALVERDGVFFAVIDKPGRATADVLGEAIPAIIRAFPWPKSMRWGAASASTASLRWVRPLHGIVALFGDDVVPCAIDGIESGAAARGHRFHHPGVITIGNADDYAAKLRACHVIVNQEERAAIIREGAAAATSAAGLSVVEDEALVIENAGLTEWPVPLLGHFDPAFLEVPREVIQLTLRTNQKYFVTTDAEGRLAPAFICTANIEAKDGGAAIVAGNGKVLAARLSDARFFWEQDLKVPLAVQAEKLKDIVFHEKLGTVADKVERVAKLARWLVEEGVVKPLPFRGGVGVGAIHPHASPADSPHPPPPSPEGEVESLATLAEQAARLCKADLVTGMVGEFPELQGIMGGYYARAEGLPDAVADAIRDHYKPVGQGDEVPTAPVTVAVSLADKLDTITAFFGINEKPSGSKDPFALRRAALAIIRIIVRNNVRLGFRKTLMFALSQHGIFWWKRLVSFAGKLDYALEDSVKKFGDVASEHGIDIARVRGESIETVLSERLSEADLPAAAYAFADMKQLEIVPFFGERLSVQQREAGVRHDLIDAVFALGGEDDLVRLLARVKALQAFVETEDGANLLAGYKRAANILRKEAPSSPSPILGEGRGEGTSSTGGDDGDVVPSPNPLPQWERALVDALGTAEAWTEAAIAREDFASAMQALAALRAPIDAFFDNVTVNDPDPAIRASRLALLERIRAAVHKVADFSRIEG